jgi:hypothetical protein
MRVPFLAIAFAATSLSAQATPPISTAPASRRVVAAKTVPPELRRPIEQFKAAIESRLPSEIEEVYSSYPHDELTRKYFKRLLDRADSVCVRSIIFRRSHVTGNIAEVTYQMIIGVTAQSAKMPAEVTSNWRADLVRGGRGEPWRIRRLTRLTVIRPPS